MKNLLKEELNQMKYLFGYERGKVISEQNLLIEDSKTLDLFESTLPEFWGDDFVGGTTFSEESVSGMVYYIATEPDGTKYYFYYYPNGNPDNKDFKFIQYQHDEDILVADAETQEEPKTQTNTQDQPNNQPVLTTQSAKEAKYLCIDILESLIAGAEGFGSDKKKESWQASLDELRATNDNELCSEENKKKVKDNLESAQEQMKKYGLVLSDEEKLKCNQLIDELKKYPNYCKS